jgi:hypothetical protein
VSETILKVLLSELTTIRIACQGCKAVSEVPIDALRKRGQGIACPGCGSVIRHGNRSAEDAFDALAEATKGLRQLSGFDVAFVLPANPQGK